ncbi:archaeosine-15-forming tRNA-guanine transglycosylase [Methanococcus voltae PS]|uniref:Archaeosine-15-forming tRNA-guanine transglycosylase n=1 Tax=Methanococcus voltae PS TaxID=523842 RepID=A0ABT2EVI5_METVO|nr:hypothetical protein [Methanococcus voltae]MCS3921965.1 archaeosine-15-forming tRNA-guanine transglycosylase [Methanococcus voltae PS]
MATSSFSREFVLSKEAAEILSEELEKQTEHYVPKKDMQKELKKGESVFKQILSHL